MTAVFEATGLKLVFAVAACSSFPYQSPARDRSFLNAAVEGEEKYSAANFYRFMNSLPNEERWLPGE
jgi:hypothetical protein